MNKFELFAFVIAPLSVLTLGWAAVFWHERAFR